MYVILLVILVLLCVGALPTWPYAHSWGWGWYPSGILGFLVLIVLIMFLFGAVGGPPRVP